jgi:peptide/nickel transport system substrate-binding protein
VYQGFAVAGSGSLLPPPWGVWGLPPAMVKQVPGRGDPVQDKAQARALLRELGFGPERPIRVTVSTRALSLYIDTAVWAIGEMKKVGIEGELDQVDSASWFSRLARRQFTLAINGTTLGVDDPDVNFFENFTCASMRNFSDYCNPAVERRFAEQSIERDPARRLPLVNEIDLQLQLEGARPILAHGPFYTAHWPRVKNFFRHQVVMNFHRLQDVWLEQ